jgi:hypothetical protein
MPPKPVLFESPASTTGTRRKVCICVTLQNCFKQPRTRPASPQDSVFRSTIHCSQAMPMPTLVSSIIAEQVLANISTRLSQCSKTQKGAWVIPTCLESSEEVNRARAVRMKIVGSAARLISTTNGIPGAVRATPCAACTMRAAAAVDDGNSHRVCASRNIM